MVKASRLRRRAGRPAGRACGLGAGPGPRRPRPESPLWPAFTSLRCRIPIEVVGGPVTNSNSRVSSQDMTELLMQRLVAVPDVLRTRGFTVAGLLMTLIGAVTAGVLFTDRSISTPAKWCATLLILLAAVAVCFFIAAGLHAQRKKVDPGKERSQLEEVISSIASMLTVGAWLAGGAAGTSLVLTGLLLWVPPSRDSVNVALSSAGTSSVASICPALGSRFEASIETGQLEKNGPLVTLTVAGKSCGRKDGTVNLTIQRDYISAVVAAA